MKLLHPFAVGRYALLVMGFIIVGSCAVNPVTGKRQVMFMSESQEIALGAQSDPAVVAQFGLYNDDKLQAFIKEKGQEMASISHRSHLKYEFKVVDSLVLNAFALPGGYVYFTRGILAHFNNEAQFAGVLGHEIGHITARHGASQQSKQMLYSGGLILGMVLSPELASMGELASQSLGLLFLKFGRDDETQSDQLGVEYSTKIGYDAKEMARFFGVLDRVSGGPEGRVPTFMSTHPDPADRNIKVEQYAKEWQAKTPGKNFEASGSFGPWMMTADEVGDFDEMEITTRLNGEVVQNAKAALLIFGFAELIEYIRVAAQLAYEELAELRESTKGGDTKEPSSGTLH